MAHSQPGMPALLSVNRRSTEPVDEKIAEPLFRALQIVLRVHWAQETVIGHLPVKCGRKSAKSLRADNLINFALFHSIDLNSRDSPP